MSFETFRVHMHDSDVQHVLSPPEHEALRVSLHADDPAAPVDKGMLMEGSPDGVNWYTVSTFLAGDLNQVIDSPWRFLRVKGYGDGESGYNGVAVVEYIDADSYAASSSTSVTIANTPLLVQDVGPSEPNPQTAATIAVERDLLEQILAELKGHTLLLNEMQA